MPFNVVFLFIVAFLNLLLAAFVVFRNPKSSVNRSFFLLVGAISFWSISVGLLSWQKTLFWSDLTLFTGNLIGISFILFAKYFPEGKPISKKFVFFFFILPVSLIIILAPFRPFVSGIIVKGDEIEPVIGPLYPILMVWMIVSPLYGCYILFKKYRKGTGIVKNQLKFIFLGFLTFLIAVTLTNVILPPLGLGRFAFIGPVFTLLMVGSSAYAIIKHRFLDIRLVIVKSIAYIALTLFIGAVYSAVVFNVAVLFSSNGINITLVTALALIFAITFQPLRRYFEKITDNIFYKDHYDANTVLWDTTRIMAATLRLEEVSKKTLDYMIEEMKIDYGSIVLTHHKAITWVTSAGNAANKPLKGNDIYRLIHEANSKKIGEKVLVFDELEESTLKQHMREHELIIVLPLTVSEQVIGGLLLGSKSSGEIYSSEDIDLLKIVGPELAIAVKNAQSYEEIKRFNITLEEEVERATDRLRKANHRLKELDVLKDEFVSIASHELRTPMTAIKSYLWMAMNQKEDKLSPEMQKYLNISYQSTERLIHLVNDMLTVSRIERNKIELKMEKFDLYDTAKLVYDELKITADEKQVTFNLTSDDKPPFKVNGDKEKLREVIQNVVGNALKFTPPNGKITINFRRGKAMIYVEVTDTGAGIPKESLSKLFQKFSKIEYSYSKHSSQPGSGLGLYISKQIVSLHNGDIAVESKVDVGTTFTVSLPASS